MVKQKYTGITKRFGSRYGVTVRKRLENVEKMYKGTHKCPYCRYLTVKRLASGIWYCRKCDKKLTGRAYELSNVKKVHEKLEEFEQDFVNPHKREYVWYSKDGTRRIEKPEVIIPDWSLEKISFLTHVIAR